MIIHIGDGVSLFQRDILIILDKKSVESSKEDQKLINNLVLAGYLRNRVDKVESYIIAAENSKE